VLSCASSETVLGLAGLVAAAGLLGSNRHGGIAGALAIGLAIQAVTYLTAAVVALAADRSLARTVGNLLDIPAVALAAELHWPAVPASRHGTPGRTPQRAWQSPAQHRAHRMDAPRARPRGRAPGKAPARAPGAGRLV
jgi:hypothetical protein